jgi:hypothetical protein
MVVCVCLTDLRCKGQDHTPVDCGFCGIVFISFMEFSWRPSYAYNLVIIHASSHWSIHHTKCTHSEMHTDSGYYKELYHVNSFHLSSRLLQ